MFDRTTIQEGDSHHYHTEKRAPTDESVRLLREMEASAKYEIYRVLDLSNNEFSGVVHMMHDYLMASTKIAVVFNLNGKAHRVNVTIKDREDPYARTQQVTKEVSEYITVQILSRVFTKEQSAQLWKD